MGMIFLLLILAIGIFFLIKHVGTIQKKYIDKLSAYCKTKKMTAAESTTNELPFIMMLKGHYSISYQRIKESPLKYHSVSRIENISASKEYLSHHIIVQFLGIPPEQSKQLLNDMNTRINQFIWLKFEKKLDGNILVGLIDHSVTIDIIIPLYSESLSKRIFNFLDDLFAIYETYSANNL